MRRKNKIQLIAALLTLSVTSNVYAAIQPLDFITDVPAEYKEIVKNGADGILSEFLSRGYEMNEYELVVLSEAERISLLKKKNVDDQLRSLHELQTSHKNAYHAAMRKGVPLAPEKATSVASPFSPQKPQEALDFEKTVMELKRRDEEQKRMQAEIDKAKNDEERKAAMSLLTVRTQAEHRPQPTTRADEITPSQELAETQPKFAETKNVETMEPEEKDTAFIALADSVNDSVLERETKKQKDYYIYARHGLYYVNEKGTGNVPLNTDVTNDNGEYYQPMVTDQYQLEHRFDIGIGVKIAEFADALFGITIKNEDGLIGGNGTTWKFSNVTFRPRANPFGKATGAAKKAGISIYNGGKGVSAELGHGTTIAGDTESGDVGIQIHNETGSISYAPSEGFKMQDNNHRYYIGIGKLSLDFSTYTLKMSEVDAVQVGYKDDDQSLVFIAAKPHDAQDGRTVTDNYGKKTEVAGQYKRILYGAQYMTKTLLPNVQLAFNYAMAEDKGSISNPNGATRGKSSVYSIAFQSENMKGTSFQGEIAHSINDPDIDTPGGTYSGNADYLDLTHKFSNRLSGTLHAVNIDKTFNAEKLVEDKTGEYLYTTNTGDGSPDYLYENGQRGFDLALNYRFPEDASIAFGWSRYSMTTDGHARTNLYLAGNKSWSVYNEDGNSVGELSVQQRFEFDRVSNRAYDRHISSTTVSGTAEPWENAEFESNYQYTRDNHEGNESRFDVSLAQNIYPLERVKITPRVKYQRKKGENGRDGQDDAPDASTLVADLTIGYQLVPDELTLNMLISKERYKINKSEIDSSTGEKVDGENRDVMGMGIGLSWEPKKIPGLTASVSYRKDKVHYYTPKDDMSHQDIWEYSLEYSKPLSDKIRASVTFDYRSARDKVKPIYNEVTRSVEISIDATLGKNQTLRVEHTYESEYKPLDTKANYTTRSTVARLYNAF